MFKRVMIIACPACSTRYVVPDSAIGVDGRTVRCAKCRHSWFQEGAELALAQGAAPLASVAAAPPAAPPPPPPPPAPEPESPPAPEPAMADDGVDVAEDPIAAEEPPLASMAEPPAVYSGRTAEPFEDDQPSSFDFAPPFRPRRNRVRMWTLAALVFAVVSLLAVVAVARYGLPDWVPISRSTFAEAQPDLELDFPANRQDRRTLPDGTEYFGASGTIRNVGQTRRSVPTILIVLRDGRERIVYSRELSPPKRLLAPGESVSINEALTDVPASARSAEIGWSPS